MKQSCGYACVIKVLKSKNISYDEEYLNQYQFKELSLFEIKMILDYYNVLSYGMHIPFKMVSNGDILHIEIFGFRHYVVMIRKGLLCICYDNGGFHIVPSYIMNRIYNKNALCFNQNL